MWQILFFSLLLHGIAIDVVFFMAVWNGNIEYCFASPDIDRSHVLHPSHLATVVPVDPGFATFQGKQLGQRALGMLVSLGVTKMTVSEVTMVTRQPG